MSTPVVGMGTCRGSYNVWCRSPGEVFHTSARYRWRVISVELSVCFSGVRGLGSEQTRTWTFLPTILTSYRTSRVAVPIDVSFASLRDHRLLASGLGPREHFVNPRMLDWSRTKPALVWGNTSRRPPKGISIADKARMDAAALSASSQRDNRTWPCRVPRRLDLKVAHKSSGYFLCSHLC